MKQVPKTEAKEGMVLGRDLLDEQGRTILRAGTVLSTSHCRMLSRREIAMLTVIESEAEAGQQAGKAISEEAQENALDDAARRRMARVEALFADVMDDERMRELFRLALQRAKQGVIRV